MPLIVGLSGRKQSGKNTIAQSLSESYQIVEVSFADSLKGFLIETMGLERHHCYGTDADKDSPTHIRWEDMPGVTTNKDWCGIHFDEKGRVKGRETDNTLIYHPPGFMTGREVMQFFGTDICRRIYKDCLVKSTIYKIRRISDAHIVAITDVRFPDEVKAINDDGGIVLRLTRNGNMPATHPSEIALDRCNYDWENFYMVVDNARMTIREQAEYVKLLLEVKMYG